jgi:hypothetical protein
MDFGFGNEAMRPRLNFGEMGIPPNSRLRWEDDHEQVEATVLNDRRVNFNGAEMSLTAATERVLGYRDHPCARWTYNGRRLSDIYDETYGPRN